MPNTRPQNQPKINHIGEFRYAKNGQQMKIIVWENYHDLDIKFEDGTIVKNKRYDHFLTGDINNPNVPNCNFINRTGETSIASNGQKMTIIAYRNARHIDIQFEDGTIVLNKTYGCFKKGIIQNPNKPYQKPPQHIGETNTARNGQKMTIIAWHDSKHIDVQFEDGTIVRNRVYQAFSEGRIENPNADASYKYQATTEGRRKKEKDSHIGQTAKNFDGRMMTIIDYTNAYNIKVRFNDGTEAVTTTFKFKKQYVTGRIYPTKAKAQDYLGKSKIMRCGQAATVIAIRNGNDIDIRFQNGDIVQHKTLNNFCAGSIKVPHMQINGIKYSPHPITMQGQKHWKCKCTKCGYVDYMTIDEMLAHKCDE